jgi:hypothetical protein
VQLWPRVSRLLLILTVACRESLPPLAPRHDRARAAGGCYRLLGAATSVQSGELASFRLVTTPVSPRRPDFYLVLPLARSRRPLASDYFVWSIDPTTDTVRVQTGDGLTGQFFIGLRRDSVLQGVSGRFGDAGPPFTFDVRPTQAMRIACP